MNILILGAGGREHAFAYKISQSELCDKLFIAPGNAGTAQFGKNIDLKLTNFDAIKDFVLKESIKMVVVGPEDPLVLGISNFFTEDLELKDVALIGPSKRGALLEGSKERAKEFMSMHKIPSAAYQSFTSESLQAGKDFLDTLKAPYVLKADGLAGGKGVLILDEVAEAKKELENMLLENKFGNAGEKVVIEEFLDGIELSVFVLTDGENYKMLPTAKDYKRIGEGNTGLNTGGMGAISPVPFANDELMRKIEERIVKPTVEGLKKEKIDYKGFIFIGLMVMKGEPYVIEYNVRMGDPETEVVLPRIKSDLVALFQKVAAKNLDKTEIEIDGNTAVTVMLVSGGYPEDYEKGKEITGIGDVEGSLVFHAGTKEFNGKIVTNGGRVLAVTSFGSDYKEALKKSYQNVDKLHFDKMYYRKDLGFDLS
ncbi:phosphoribosylamine--glycine ligase [Gillisia limnaea]|uniref:Phosphoribosylamine--glycine ligase n=1 Tax=Gillisia limnaea (strain DSM 15749 / LMG 21470 / R-8282) TaxID=865937 RepID=H2BUB9_GILLR|nr:phosphoribosylamine--glycine ligase [Gillisia limnaea]EHQ02753.1 Phosphoribosylamine--glycine ligase [Gillisia limnaea DSM 15749]